MELSIAVLSDIHGNSFALAAVLAEIQRRNIRWVINLGDTFYGPLDIAGSYSLLQESPLQFTHICGNGDRMLLTPADKARDNATVLYSKHCLDDSIKAFLAAMPTSYSNEWIYACHGSPRSDTEYLLEEMHEQGGVLKPTAQIAEALAGVGRKLVLCGHSHLARTLSVPYAGQVVVNPGSVGLPAYADDLPCAHIMEAGSPLAQFAVISRQADCWQVEQIQLPYNWQAAAALAEKNARPDWAFALATGRVQ